MYTKDLICILWRKQNLYREAQLREFRTVRLALQQMLNFSKEKRKSHNL